MSIFAGIEQAAAIRFRRSYLEVAGGTRTRLRDAVRLAYLLSVTVSTSREVLGGALMCLVTLMFTSPFGTTEMAVGQKILFFFPAYVLAALSTWVFLLPVYVVRIKGWIGDAVTMGVSAIVTTICTTGSFLVAELVFGFGPGMPVWEMLLRVFLVVSLTFWLGRTFATYPIEVLLRRNLDFGSLVARLPLDKRGRLLSISAQDHYVEITTTQGTELVRMSMKKALASVDQNAGASIHRSHWVSFEAIQRVDEQNNRVELEGGTSLPIAASKMSAITLALSKKDDPAGMSERNVTKPVGRNILLKLSRNCETYKKELDELLLEVYRGRSVDTKSAYKITGLLQKIGLTSPVFITMVSISILAPIALGSYGVIDVPLYLVALFWVCIIIASAPLTQSAHFLAYYVGFKFRLIGWMVSLLLFATESTLAGLVMFLTSVAIFGDGSASAFQFMLGVYCCNFVLNTVAHSELYSHRSIASWENRITYPPIVMLMPHETRGDLISISANDRYVEVATTSGKSSVRLKLKDAIEKIGGFEGLQIHRSHWVAKSHIRALRLERAGNYVELSNRTLIPISPAQVDAVEKLFFGT